jgi:anti-sigma B factor antagonist
MTSIRNRGDAREFARLDYAATGPEGAHLRLTLHDDIDLAVAPLLQDTLDTLTAIAPCRVVIDLAEVTFLSSTGLSFLAAANNHATAHGHTVTVTNPAPIVRRVLHICGFDKVITIIG